MAVPLACLILGILLVLAGKWLRSVCGLTQGRTTSLDNRTLYSRVYGLCGRPDRIVGGIPEEWKPGSRVYDSYRAQVGAYLILIEEETGVRPPHGWVVLEGGQRVRIENTPELRAWVLDIADKVRAVKRNPHQPITVNQPAAKCRGCGVRDGCLQRNW